MRVRRHSAATVALMVMAATVVWSGAHAAAADGLLARVSVTFQESVLVGETFPASVEIANLSTPPGSTVEPVLTVSAVDLVPACTNTIPDCPGGVDAGVFRVAATGVGTGPASCAGTWTITETTPGTYRLNPPGGNGTLLVAAGETCAVGFSVLAYRVPTTDVNQVVAATFSGPNTAPFRIGGSNAPTVAPPVAPPSDFDGSGTTDLAVFRPSNSVWYSPGASVEWGTSGDVPVPGDYDFDGTTDRAVFRPSSGVWHVARSSGGATSVAWGVSGDIPVPGDYDGDGRTDQAVFRPRRGSGSCRRARAGPRRTRGA